MCLRSLDGFLPWLKGYQRTFDLPRSLTTFPKLVRTEWNEEPAGRCVGVFDQGAVRLCHPDTGQVRAASADHRRTFRGLRKLRRWGPLDAFYFFGYSFASYTAVPFILPGLRFHGALSGSWRGERLRGVRVEFPPGAHVHSRRQQYLFDGSGLLRRNDYVADVVGGWASGAHGWDDFASVDGLAIPARRTVMPHLVGVVWPVPTVLSATFERFAATFAS